MTQVHSYSSDCDSSFPLPPPSVPESDMYALYAEIDKLRGAFQKDFAPNYPWYPILEELVRTEDQYLADISSIVRCYIPKFSELEQELPNLITPQTSHLIFINLEEIRNFHQCFYQELKPLLGGDSLENVGKLFQEEAEKFKIYSEYCSKHTNSVDLLVKLTKNKTIDKHLKAVQSSLQHPLNLSTYLLKPVQRVLKYKLLLQSMLKHCVEDTSAHLMLSSAAESMDSIAKEINELKAISDNKQILEEIQEGLDSTPFAGSLNDFGNIHLQDTMLDLKAAKSRQERMVILMDDALLICKVREKQAKGTFRGRKSPFKFKDLIKLTELTFTQDDHVKKDDQAFLVHKQNGRTRATYCLRAKSVVKKNHWVSTLQDLILSSFHFAPDMLQQILDTLRYSTLSLNTDSVESNPFSKFNSLSRNMKLIPISKSTDVMEDKHASDDDEDTKRPQSMYNYITVTESVPSHKLSNLSGDIYCEQEVKEEARDESVKEQVRRYSKTLELRSRPRLATPTDDNIPNSAQERDSGISDRFSSSTQVKAQMRELLSTMQQDYATFQDSTRERDSGVEDVEIPSQLDFMSIKRKHEGMVQSLVRNYMNTVSEQNERNAKLDSPSPITRPKLSSLPDPKKSDPILPPSPIHPSKPPLSPKPTHLKPSSPHHKAKYNSRAPAKTLTPRLSLPEDIQSGTRTKSGSSSNSNSNPPSRTPAKTPSLKIESHPSNVSLKIESNPSKVSGMASQWERTIEAHREECKK